MSRELKYDLMRCVAILLVATQHAWSMLGLDTEEHGMLCFCYRAIVDCGVPLFVLVSGALNLRSVSDTRTFFRKRFVRVLVPFLLWALPIYVVSAVMGKYAEVTDISSAVRQYVPFLFENKINTSHWFIHMLIVLYLFTPLLQRVVHGDDGKRVTEYMLWLLFVLVLLKWLVPELYIMKYVTTLFTYVGLYVAGYYISTYLTDAQRNIRLGAVALPVLYLGDVLTACPDVLLTHLTAVALFILMSAFLTSQSRFDELLTAVSRYSYFIYLVHIPLIGLLYMFAGRYVPLSSGLLSAVAPVLFSVVAVGVCALAGKVLDLLLRDKAVYLGISR